MGNTTPFLTRIMLTLTLHDLCNKFVELALALLHGISETLSCLGKVDETNNGDNAHDAQL